MNFPLRASWHNLARTVLNLGPVDSPRQGVKVAGQSLEDFNPRAEAKDEGLVAGAQQLAQEVFGRVFLDRQRFVLTGGGIDGERQGQRRVRRLREVPDVLRNAVFGQLEIRPLEVSNEMALPVSHDRGDVDHLGHRFERRVRTITLGLTVRSGLSDGGESDPRKQSNGW